MCYTVYDRLCACNLYTVYFRVIKRVEDNIYQIEMCYDIVSSSCEIGGDEKHL